MLPDDVYRSRLEQTLVEIEAWAAKTRDCAVIDVTASPHYWRISVLPHFVPACPFALMITSEQRFSLKLATESYENRAIESFEFFPKLAKAIEAGRVESIEMFDAATGFLARRASRVELGPGWTWIGEHRCAPQSRSEEWRAHRFLPYRR